MRKPRAIRLCALAAPLLLLQLDFSGCSLTSSGGAGGGGTLFNSPPTVVLTSDVTRGIAPLTVRFSSSGSSDDGVIVSRVWNFGDEQTSQDVSPTHVFQSTGQFTVRLTLRDDNGATSTRSVIVSVTESPIAVIKLDRATAPNAPAVINFDASDSDDPDGEIVAYQWDFGDGSRELIPVVAHTFASPGEFRVRLTVTDDTGVTDTADRIIEIGIPQPQVAFRTPPADIENIVLSPDSPLWVAVTFSVEPGVPRTLRAGLDGDDDPCEAQTAVYDAANGQLLRRLEGHDAPVRAVALSPDGSLVVSAGDDRFPRAYDADNGSLVDSFGGSSAAITSLAFAPDSASFIAGNADGSVLQYDAVGGNVIDEFVGHTATVNAVAFAPNGSRIASGDADGIGIVWNVSDGSQVRQLIGHTFGITAIAFAPTNANLVATGSIDQTAKLWNVATGQIVRDFAPVLDGGDLVSGHANSVTSVAFSPDGSTLVTGSDDRTAIVWDVSSGDAILTISGHSDRVVAVAYSPDGTLIATGSADGSARIWNATTGAQVRSLRPCSSLISSVVFSPDGAELYTGVAAANDILLDSDPPAGNDANLLLPTALDVGEVPTNRQYFLWAEVDTDRTDPVRTYAAPIISVTPAFTASIDNFTPRAPLEDDNLSAVPKPTTTRQIFDVGPLREGDEVNLSVLSVPGYSRSFELPSDASIMLLDAEEKLFAWIRDGALFDRNTKLIVGHNSSKYFVVIDGGIGVDLSIVRGVGATPRQQRVYLNFAGGRRISVGGLPIRDVPVFDAADIQAGYTEGDTSVMRNAIVNTVRDLLSDWDFDVTTSDETDPPDSPHIVVYFGGESDTELAVQDYVDIRNQTQSGNVLILTDTFNDLLPGLSVSELGDAIGRETVRRVGYLVGLNNTEGENDIMNPDLPPDNTALDFLLANLRDDELFNGQIGIQDARLLLTEIVGD